MKLLDIGAEKDGFGSDDVLAVLLPLMKQVLATHERNLVAPLNGIQELAVADEGYLSFAPGKARPKQKNTKKIEALQAPMSRALEVLAESRLTVNIDEAALSVSDLAVGAAGSDITKPVFLPNYQSWEHAVGHHDELADIFSLGLLLASLSCGLDLTDAGELQAFATNRSNLFSLNHRLNPVLALVIVQMTELNRHKRA